MQTTATRTDSGWLLDGHKRWISNAPVASLIVTLARTGERLSLFIVDTILPGVRVGEADRKMGNRGQLTADVHLDNVQLSDNDLLGGTEGQGLRQAVATLTYGRIGIAAAGVGMARPPSTRRPRTCPPAARSAGRWPRTSIGSSSWPSAPPRSRTPARCAPRPPCS